MTMKSNQAPRCKGRKQTEEKQHGLAALKLAGFEIDEDGEALGRDLTVWIWPREDGTAHIRIASKFKGEHVITLRNVRIDDGHMEVKPMGNPARGIFDLRQATRP